MFPVGNTISMAASDSHPLADWIEEHSTRGEFATAVGCSESHLCNILARRKQPSIELLGRISGVTGNVIGVAAFTAREGARCAQ